MIHEKTQKRLLTVVPYDSDFHDRMLDRSEPEYKLKDTEVISEMRGDWPGRHRHVNVWWICEGGIAVGWDDNPELGWSFPVIEYEHKVETP